MTATDVLERPDVVDDLERLVDQEVVEPCQLSDQMTVILGRLVVPVGGWQDCPHPAEWVVYVAPAESCSHYSKGSTLICEVHRRVLLEGLVLFACDEPGCYQALRVRSVERLR